MSPVWEQLLFLFILERSFYDPSTRTFDIEWRKEGRGIRMVFYEEKEKTMSRMETAVAEVKQWGNEELVMLELDPGLEMLERMLRKGAKMVNRLKKGQERRTEHSTLNEGKTISIPIRGQALRHSISNNQVTRVEMFHGVACHPKGFICFLGSGWFLPGAILREERG
jgi:hypothetical protein